MLSSLFPLISHLYAVSSSFFPPILTESPRFPLFVSFLLLFSPNGGWGAALANEYVRKACVVNRGMSGYTSAAVLLALDRLLESAAMPQPITPDLAIIFLGANDAALPHSCSGQHVPIEQYKQNLRTIAERVSLAVKRKKEKMNR